MKKKEKKAKTEKPKKNRPVLRFFKRHKMITYTLLLLLLFGGVVLGARFVIWFYKVETNVDARYSSAQLARNLSKYKDLKTFLDEESIENQTYVIPGLKSTRTLTSNDAGKLSVCHMMTPQGICVTEDYLLISAYCHMKKHNSVIYVMSRTSHEFIKEIVLPGRPHVGSMAYDPEHQNIWVTCYSKNMAYVNSFTLDDLEEYFLDDTCEPIAFRQKEPLHKIQRASFMCYYDSSLYVGYFEGDREMISIMQRYPIADDGSLRTISHSTSDIGMEDTKLSVNIEPYAETLISAQCQGMAFYSKYLFISESFSTQYSKLQVVARDEDGDLYDATDDAAILTLTLPPMLEQICIDGDEMYLMFESAGTAYSWRVPTSVDRVLRVKVDDIAAVLQ